MNWRDLASHARIFEQFDWWSLDELASHVLAAPDARAALCIAPIAPGDPVAWLRWLAIADSDSPARSLPALFAAEHAHLRTLGVTSLWAICRRGDWLTRHLRDAGYRKADEIITLEHRVAQPSPAALDLTPFRAAVDADIAAIAQVDAMAFNVPWRYPAQVLVRVLTRCRVFDVAMIDGVIAGYVAATLDAGNAHIIRLAVLPAFRARGIGGGLLEAARTALLAAGATRVTINTPASFTAIHLYRRLGYRPLLDIADVYGHETN
jgi:[ribosomal protein S18]-alanine N-acetyltransferase